MVRPNEPDVERLPAKPASASRMSLSMLTNPGQANIFGLLHGGVILRMADECGALSALRHAGGEEIATATVDSLTFLGPVHPGERIEFTAEVTYVGRTSIETRVEVHAEPFARAEPRRVGVGYILYVALDDDGRPRAVPPLLTETDADRARDRAAQARQAARLARRQETRAE